jgi:D-arabinose 1-dehydrogenase-like Zn-dependent alcohol dehydrogenase
MAKMRAAVVRDFHQPIRVEEVEKPTPGEVADF